MLKRLIKRRFPLTYYRLSRWRQKVSISKYPIREAQHFYGGFPLRILLSDSTAETWYDMDWPELPEIELLRQHRLKPGARVFNIGAHQGVVALMLARIVEREGCVIAVEPEPHNVRIAERNKLLNGICHMRVLHAAVAEHSGQLPIRCGLDLSQTDRFRDWDQLGVAALQLDELSRKYGLPDVLFIDVDGFECQVLRGGRNTINQVPDCFVEVHVGAGLEREGGTLAEVLSFFPTESYDLWIASEEHRQFVPFDASSFRLNSRFFLVAVSRAPSATIRHES